MTLAHISLEEHCPICHERIMGKFTVTKCGHSFHHHCVLMSLKYTPTCPICRQESPIDRLTTLTIIDPTLPTQRDLLRQLQSQNASFAKLHSVYKDLYLEYVKSQAQVKDILLKKMLDLVEKPVRKKQRPLSWMNDDLQRKTSPPDGASLDGSKHCQEIPATSIRSSAFNFNANDTNLPSGYENGQRLPLRRTENRCNSRKVNSYGTSCQSNKRHMEPTSTLENVRERPGTNKILLKAKKRALT